MGVTRTYRAWALASIAIPLLLRLVVSLSAVSQRLAALGLSVVLHMPLECAGWGKFTELVADHVLRNKHRHVLAAVMDRNRVAEHRGDDH